MLFSQDTVLAKNLSKVVLIIDDKSLRDYSQRRKAVIEACTLLDETTTQFYSELKSLLINPEIQGASGNLLLEIEPEKLLDIDASLKKDREELSLDDCEAFRKFLHVVPLQRDLGKVLDRLESKAGGESIISSVEQLLISLLVGTSVIEIAVRENRILFPPGKAGEIGVDTFGRQSVVWFDEKDKEKLGNAFMVDDEITVWKMEKDLVMKWGEVPPRVNNTFNPAPRQLAGEPSSKNPPVLDEMMKPTPTKKDAEYPSVQSVSQTPAESRHEIGNPSSSSFVPFDPPEVGSDAEFVTVSRRGGLRDGAPPPPRAVSELRKNPFDPVAGLINSDSVGNIKPLSPSRLPSKMPTSTTAEKYSRKLRLLS